MLACGVVGGDALTEQPLEKQTTLAQDTGVVEIACEASLADINAWLAQKKYEQVLPVVEQWGRKLPSGLAERVRLIMLGKCLLGLKRHDEAVDCLQKACNAEPEALDAAAVEACTLLGFAYAQQKQTERAKQMWFKAAEMTPLVELKTLGLKKSPTYFLNRVSLGGTERELAVAWERIAALHQEYGDRLSQTDAMLQRLALAANFPGMRQLAVETGRLLLECDNPNLASTLFLRALDTGLDRCFTLKARLAENQSQLNLVAKPPTEQLVREAISGLNECLSAVSPTECLPVEQLAAFSDSCYHALVETYRPDTGHGDTFWALAKTAIPGFWRSFCLLQAAQAYLREGCFHQCRLCVRQALSKPMGIVGQAQFDHLDVLAAAGEGKYREAAKKLGGADLDAQSLPASSTLLTLAECQEAAFEFLKAENSYRHLSASTRCIRHKMEADYALKRLETLQGLKTVAEEQRCLFVLPDDRSTRGDWALGYGLEAYLLAAHEFKRDTNGGLVVGSGLKCRFRTTKATEKSRLWVTRKSVEDVSALWNPRRATRTAANRDDYGEQYPIGAGPDLLMSCEVPKGTHLLSLYFVNDYNYYESNRAYTVTATDENGHLLCAVPVRHFGGGLYKRFAVDGPVTLQFRMWRNTSINVIFAGAFLDSPFLPPIPACLSKENDSLQNCYNELRKAVETAKAADLPVLLDKGNELFETISQKHSQKTKMTSVWMQAKLASFTGRPREGMRLLKQAVNNSSSLGEIYTLIMDTFAGQEVKQRTISWLPPGCHELDVLWQTYFRKLAESGECLGIGELMRMAQSNDWRITSCAMKEAWTLLERQRKMPVGAQLATELCIAGKIVGEERDAVALSALDALERKARETGDAEVLKRVADHFLTLSGRLPMDTERLMGLCSLANDNGMPEEILETAALRVAESFARKRDFRKAREWLDKVPDALLSSHGRQVLLKRWHTMEDALNNRKKDTKGK
ncbi:MAG: hypothetical protein IJJ33_20495 [Victivallales bacterium]|nr:hypothetical protein [Victivallales bacterium]